MSRTPKTQPDGREVGYGRPPRHAQFKAGQSGNPGGRPKQQGKVAVDLAAILDETVTVTKDGKPCKMSQKEVALRKILQKAIDNDNLKAILYLIDQFERYGALDFSQTSAGGVVQIPYWIPMRMGCFLVEQYGHPPWSKSQIDKARSVYLSTRSKDEKLKDEDIESLQHDIEK